MLSVSPLPSHPQLLDIQQGFRGGAGMKSEGQLTHRADIHNSHNPKVTFKELGIRHHFSAIHPSTLAIVKRFNSTSRGEKTV